MAAVAVSTDFCSNALAGVGHHSGCLAHLHQLADGRVLTLGVGRRLQNDRSCLDASFTQRRCKARHEHVPRLVRRGREGGSGFHGIQFTATLKLLAWHRAHRYLGMRHFCVMQTMRTFASRCFCNATFFFGLHASALDLPSDAFAAALPSSQLCKSGSPVAVRVNARHG